MQVDASLNKQVADVRQFQITLTPTARATNQVQLSGQVDMSQTNAIQGNLKLVADSLDFTSYYDLFMGGKQAPATGPATAAPQTARTSAPAPADANKEPEPMKLPLRNFTAEASIRRLYLHEVEIADWQTTTKIDGGHVVVNPFKLTLNGAPVNSTVDLDLGVPGWKYDTSLSAQAIPLAPLVNSFQPERKGQIGGTMTVQGRYQRRRHNRRRPPEESDRPVRREFDEPQPHRGQHQELACSRPWSMSLRAYLSWCGIRQARPVPCLSD